MGLCESSPSWKSVTSLSRASIAIAVLETPAVMTLPVLRHGANALIAATRVAGCSSIGQWPDPAIST